MVASVLCHLCQPIELPGLPAVEPTHHHGKRMAQTQVGLLGGWECYCECSKAEEPAPTPMLGVVIDFGQEEETVTEQCIDRPDHEGKCLDRLVDKAQGRD